MPLVSRGWSGTYSPRNVKFILNLPPTISLYSLTIFIWIKLNWINRFLQSVRQPSWVEMVAVRGAGLVILMVTQISSQDKLDFHALQSDMRNILNIQAQHNIATEIKYIIIWSEPIRYFHFCSGLDISLFSPDHPVDLFMLFKHWSSLNTTREEVQGKQPLLWLVGLWCCWHQLSFAMKTQSKALKTPFRCVFMAKG